jgi:hypothetical protein
MKLDDFIGEEIKISIPYLGEEFENVKLHGVESGGIWIESQHATNIVLAASGASGIPKAIVLFFPYSQIRLAMVFAPGASLNEKSFGV